MIPVIPTLTVNSKIRRILNPNDITSETGDKHLINGNKSSIGGANSSYAPNFSKIAPPRRNRMSESNVSPTNKQLNKKDPFTSVYSYEPSVKQSPPKLNDVFNEEVDHIKQSSE